MSEARLTVRCLIVDDELPARERLRELLSAYPDLEVVGEAADGEEAIERIVELTPDLVFLDIQMPGCSGMEVANSLRSPRPRIVFCTAYDEYAVDAFELHALDYLLKPVSRPRLDKAVERVRQAPSSDREQALDRVAAHPTRFLARRGARYVVVPEADVLFFTSEESVTQVWTEKQQCWMQLPLNDLERRLDPQRFFRVSRAAIVSLDRVREVIPRAGGQAELTLTNGAQIEVSRRRVAEFMERLKGVKP